MYILLVHVFQHLSYYDIINFVLRFLEIIILMMYHGDYILIQHSSE